MPTGRQPNTLIGRVRTYLAAHPTANAAEVAKALSEPGLRPSVVSTARRQIKKQTPGSVAPCGDTEGSTEIARLQRRIRMLSKINALLLEELSQ